MPSKSWSTRPWFWKRWWLATLMMSQNSCCSMRLALATSRQQAYMQGGGRRESGTLGLQGVMAGGARVRESVAPREQAAARLE